MFSNKLGVNLGSHPRSENSHYQTKPLKKPGIHYAIFALIFPRFYSLNKLTLVEESQSQSADSTENHVVYYGHRLFSFTIYKVGKCMMPSVLKKSVQILKVM